MEDQPKRPIAFASGSRTFEEENNVQIGERNSAFSLGC